MKTAAGITASGVVGIGGQIVIAAFRLAGHPLGDEDKVLVTQIVTGIVGLLPLIYALVQHARTHDNAVSLAHENIAVAKEANIAPSPIATQIVKANT